MSAFGVMLKKTHLEIVGQMEERMLNLQKSHVEQLGKLQTQIELLTLKKEVQELGNKVESIGGHTSISASKSKTGLKAPIAPRDLRDVDYRMEVLENVLPSAKFSVGGRYGRKIFATFNNETLPVSISRATKKVVTFSPNCQKCICVLLNEDLTLRSVFVDNTKASCINIRIGSEKDLNLIQNTGLVKRNFK